MKTNIYFDASAFVKRYVSEKGSAFVSEICESPFNYQVYLSRITGIEVACALKRACRDHRISDEDYSACSTSVKSYFTLPSAFAVIEFNLDISRLAFVLSEKYGLKGYDTIQLATALHLKNYMTYFDLGDLVFICSDKDLMAAAVSENMSARNPEQDV